MTFKRFLCLGLGLISHAAAASFELRDGERVALLGDGFIEGEQYQGWLELAATVQFPRAAVSFRNLGWSADTPAGASRAGLSVYQAGLEPADEGWRQLLRQLSLYRPDAIVLGYGMASSLPGGQTPEEFRRDFEKLLDEAPAAAGKPVRFLIVGPPPRFALPAGVAGGELEQHRQMLAKIDWVLKAVAEARGLPFVSLQDLPQDPAFSDDGIHLTSAGYRAVARQLEQGLGWQAAAWDRGDAAERLRRHILKKNEWFFHRSRPANMAYIFGFRDKEQGQNAKEIGQFDGLVEAEERKIAALRDLTKSVDVADEPIRTASAIAQVTQQPYPDFKVAEGCEITLWAENPMIQKPTQMNFDPQGRLWVASSEVYPQVEVGQTANDRIIVLADRDGDGRAEESKVFAEGLLIPTAVIPGDGGCYVGQSTDLLHFRDRDGDGRADEKRRVLSGFGTEDTHHNLHTLRRGPDGSLWMNQSIYTRSDCETPRGLMRLRSGGILRFEPRQGELRPVFFGWINPWGHQFDRFGQSFVTDGAGGGGINWGLPGAFYETSAGAARVLGSVSPGSYPKFSGLEILESPMFPDWQGALVTCDFRAHRVVRFSVADQGAGYAAQEEKGELVRCEDVQFRPIDVKQGPDGALYIADWSNPIINHGEVDFRDPRRDRIHGRIWRLSRKGAAPLAKTDFRGLADGELLKRMASANRFEREQAMAAWCEKPSAAQSAALAAFTAAAEDDAARLAALWAGRSRGLSDPDLLEKLCTTGSGPARAAAVRVLAEDLPQLDRDRTWRLLAKAVEDEYPRVRLEAVRALAGVEGPEAMDLAFRVLARPMDRFLDYALWLGVRDHGEAWLKALAAGAMPAEGREGALTFAMTHLGAEKSAALLESLRPKPLPRDGAGPWPDLLLRVGTAESLRPLFDQALDGGFTPEATRRVLEGLARAVERRPVSLTGDFAKLAPLLESGDRDLRIAAVRLAGAASAEAVLPRLTELTAAPVADEELRAALIEALARFKGEGAAAALMAIEGHAAAERPRVALALALNHRELALPRLVAAAAAIEDATVARGFWQQALSYQGLSVQLAEALRRQPLSATAARVALQQVPEVKEHAALLQELRQQAGWQEGGAAVDLAALAKRAAERGDPSRGEAVYRRAALACAACHAIGGAGGKVGPDLTSIGASAPLDYLVESVLLPGAKVKEGYHSVLLETRDGRSLMGQLIRRSGGESVLRDASGAELTVADAAIVKRTDVGSLMPGGLTQSLSDQELDDLFRFLSMLGKAGDFDATKSKAPRSWQVGAWSAEAERQALAGSSWQETPVLTTVNGRLLNEDVATATGGAKEVLAGARLQLAGESEVTLSFAGVQPAQVWIDGAPVTGEKVRLAAGRHAVVVRYAPTAEPMVMQCSQGTFLADW